MTLSMSVEYREYLLDLLLLPLLPTSLLSRGVEARSSLAICFEIFFCALAGDTLSDIDAAGDVRWFVTRWSLV